MTESDQQVLQGGSRPAAPAAGDPDVRSPLASRMASLRLRGKCSRRRWQLLPGGPVKCPAAEACAGRSNGTSSQQEPCAAAGGGSCAIRRRPYRWRSDGGHAAEEELEVPVLEVAVAQRAPPVIILHVQPRAAGHQLRVVPQVLHLRPPATPPSHQQQQQRRRGEGRAPRQQPRPMILKI